jgi:hypothetical protein
MPIILPYKLPPLGCKTGKIEMQVEIGDNCSDKSKMKVVFEGGNSEELVSRQKLLDVNHTSLAGKQLDQSPHW